MTREDETLFHALATNDLPGIRVAIAVGADVNGRDEWGKTPLHWAVSHGYTDAAALLLERGADVNARDAGNETPLHWAARLSRTDTARLLDFKGADVAAKDEFQVTPLDLAARANNRGMIALLNGDTGQSGKHAGRITRCGNNDDLGPSR